MATSPNYWNLWQHDVKRYEEDHGAALPNEVKIARLLTKTKGALQQHFQLRAEQITNHNEIRASWTTTRRSLLSQPSGFVGPNLSFAQRVLLFSSPKHTQQPHVFWGSVFLPCWQAQHFGCEKGTFSAGAWRCHFNRVNVLLQWVNMCARMTRNGFAPVAARVCLPLGWHGYSVERVPVSGCAYHLVGMDSVCSALSKRA